MAQTSNQKITKRFVDNVDIPKSGQTFYNDSELRGFKLRVTASGCKSYIVERRVNGINRRLTIGKHGALTPELARREAIKLLAGMAVGEDPTLRKQERKVSAMTLGEVLEHYLANSKLRPNTVNLTVSVLNRCAPDWLPKPITSITASMIIERHKQLPHETIQGTKGEVEANMCIAIINRLMNYAINNFEMPDGTPILPVNPVRRFVRNRSWYEEEKRRNVIPDSRLAAWYRAVMSLEQETYRDFFLVLLLTGLRRGEAASLAWEQVDLENKTITIPSSVTKNKEWHTLPLSDFLAALLDRRKRLAGHSRYVFPRTDPDKHIAQSWRVVSHVVHRADFDFTLHDLRSYSEFRIIPSKIAKVA